MTILDDTVFWSTVKAIIVLLILIFKLLAAGKVTRLIMIKLK